MDEQIFDFLANQHPYDQISSKALSALIADASIQRFAAEDTIYQLGTEVLGLYIVRSGKVEIRDALGDVLSVLLKGNSFGERGLLSAEGLAVTQAKAVEDCELVFIPKARFLDLRKNESAFARFFDRQSRIRRRASTTQDFNIAPVTQVMSPDVISVESTMSIEDAALVMKAHHVSSLPVVDDGVVQGIFTIRDLVYKVIANEKKPKTVREIMSSPAIAVPSTALVIDAMVEMARQNIGQLLVLQNSELVGIVTQSNLVTRGANSIMGVLLEISRAPDPASMKKSVQRLPELLAQFAGAGVDGFVVTRLITDIADAVTKRLIALYTQEHGDAPAPFVWAACGSQGRQEQTGVSDQDNCIIYADEVRDDSWYQGLAKFVSDGMDLVGYYYCPGDMMATNPKWCQNLKTWRGYFRDWVQSPTEEAQMLASVMFDLRAIDGDASLLTNLQENVLKMASENSIFVAFLISNSLKHQPPLSLFRGFSTIRDGEHKNTIDLKHSGVVPITDLARVYAIQTQTHSVNTRTRLMEAMANGTISQSGGEDLVAAYDFIQEVRLAHQARQIRRGETPDNFLDPSLLSELERSHLRDAFVVVKSMQSALSRSAPS